MKLIPINKPLLDEEEVIVVSNVLRSGILTSRAESGSMVGRLEKAFANFVESKYAFAVNNGTTALQLSLLASKIGKGDEVIVPSFTFVATAEAVVLVGAEPVFVDIDPSNYNIDLDAIKNAITKKTKAIIPVDLFGLPVEMKPIIEVAQENDLVVIEDAAQAHGAKYAGRPPGAFADFACWSFYASKNMTTGEGGMITTNNKEYANKLPYMRTHGEKGEYVSSMIGGNFRMPEMEAAIGLVQLRKLPTFLKIRKKNADTLTKKLQEVSDLQLPLVPKGYNHSWYLFTIRLKNASKKERDSIIGKLRKLGIGATAYYPVPIHLMPFYRKYAGNKLPNTEKAAEQVLSLPIHPAVTKEQINYIAVSMKKILQK